MDWQEILLKVVVAVACAIAGGIVVFIFGKSGLIDKIFKRHNMKKQAKKEQEQNELVEKFGNLMDTKLAPLEKSVKELEKREEGNTASLVVMTRCHLKDDKDEFEKKGFATESEKASWKEMLSVYRDNGGNHFKEYVDEWEKVVMALPNRPAKAHKKHLKRK